MTAAVAGFGRVDSLVNAAGLTSRGTLLDTTPELFDAHIAVNLKAPFFLMQAVVADLVARQAPGTIVNVLSMSAHGGQPYLAPYVAAKAGLAGLTRNAAHAHRWDRIRINGMNIGWTDTEGEDETQRRFHGAGDDWREQAARRCPWAGWAAGRDRRLRGVPALGPLRRGDRLGDRLGPERPGRLRLSRGSPRYDMNAAFMSLKRDVAELILIVNGRCSPGCGADGAAQLSCIPVTAQYRPGNPFIRHECRVHVVPAA